VTDDRCILDRGKPNLVSFMNIVYCESIEEMAMSTTHTTFSLPLTPSLTLTLQ